MFVTFLQHCVIVVRHLTAAAADDLSASDVGSDFYSQQLLAAAAGLDGSYQAPPPPSRLAPQVNRLNAQPVHEFINLVLDEK